MTELIIPYIICISLIFYFSRGLTWKETISLLEIRKFDKNTANRVGVEIYKKRKKGALISLYLIFFIPFFYLFYLDFVKQSI